MDNKQKLYELFELLGKDISMKEFKDKLILQKITYLA